MSNMLTENQEGDLRNVNYRVVENAAASRSKGQAVYSGQVQVKETYGLADVARRMVAEGCAVKESTVRLVLSDFAEMVAELVSEGRAVNISGLVRFAPSVRGVFENAEAPWDPAQHKVVVNATVGARLRTAAAESPVCRVGEVIMPKLEEVIDLVSLQPNVISSESPFVVMGEHLTWDPEKEDEGFFLNLMGVETHCSAISDGTNPKRAIVSATQVFLSSGQKLELFFRTRLDGVNMRMVKFPHELTTLAEEDAEAGTESEP